MKTDIAKQNTGQELQAHTLKASAFAAYGNATSQNAITGKLLKFAKGFWVTGKEETPFPASQKLTAIMDEALVGWIKWVDQRPEQQLTGRIAENYRPQKRDELGDLEEDLWDVDDRGAPKDPWQLTNILVLRKTGTDGKDNDDLFTFSTSTKGGVSAFGALCTIYAKEMREHGEDLYPVIQLETSSYKHPNKHYGTIQTPVFKVVDWEPVVPVVKAKAVRGKK